MKPNYIFGLTRRLLSYEEPIRSGWVIDTGQGGPYVDMGTPCLVFKYPEEESMRGMENHPLRKTPHKVALVPFHFSKRESRHASGLVLDNHNNTNNLALQVGEPTDFFDTIKEIEVPQLDLSKVKKATDFVRDGGPLTLLVTEKDSKSPANKLGQFIKELDKQFSFSVIGRVNSDGRRQLSPGDRCLMAVTLIDVGQCLPIYDPSKVDGVILNVASFYTAASEAKDRLVSACSANFLFSNHKSNIFEVDGQKLDRPASPWKYLEKTISGFEPHFSQVGESREAGKEAKKEAGKRGRSLSDEIKEVEKLVLKKSSTKRSSEKKENLARAYSSYGGKYSGATSYRFSTSASTTAGSDW